MNAAQLFIRIAMCVLACISMTNISFLSAASLSWEGDTGSQVLWTEGVVGTDTNWTDGVGVPPADQVNPGVGDDLTFLGSGDYTNGPLDLNGLTYEISGITVGKAGDIPESTFGGDRILASNGLIQLGSGGITSDQLVGGEDISFNANIELTNDNATTTISKTTTVSNYLYLNGVISGGTVADPTHLSLSSPGINSGRAIRLTEKQYFYRRSISSRNYSN